MEQVSLDDIARHCGTPTFVYSETEIRNAYQAFDLALEAHDHQICYAVKANSNLAIIQVLAELGAGFDIVSSGELARVIQAGGDPSLAVFSGVGKQDQEMEYALREGIGCFNVESASELQRLSVVASALGLQAPVSIRVNPNIDPNTHPYIATGLRENKFGVSVDEALWLYQQAAADPNLAIIGIDCHLGSQITELKPFLDALALVLGLVDQLESQGIDLQHLDLGGGMGVRYQDETPLDIETFASAIGQMMKGRRQRLVFEPGRMLVANAGILLTRVLVLKSNEVKNFAVVDAAMNDLIRPALYGAWQEVEPVTSAGDQPVQTWDLVGPVCETADFLARDRDLAISEGDLLAVKSAGAYGFTMSSNYNSRPRAAEVLVSGDRYHEVRRRETTESLFALESMRPASHEYQE